MPFLTKYIKDFPLPSGDTLLLNTLTSAMDIVDPPTWEKIRSISSPESTVTEEAEPKLFSSLRSRGYVFNDHQDEAGSFRRCDASRLMLLSLRFLPTS